MNLLKCFFLSLLFFSSLANAQIKVVFVNGIDGYPLKNSASSIKLKEIIEKAGYGSKFSNAGVIHTFRSNSGDGFFDDKIELFKQAELSAQAYNMAKRDSGNEDIAQNQPTYYQHLGRLYDYGIKNGIADTEESRHVYSVVRDLAQYISNEVLVKGNKIILVGHSQGNFFTEAVAAYLTVSKTVEENANFDKNLRFVGVASVASTSPNYRYISVYEDKALAAHVALTAGIRSFYLLPRNSKLCNTIDPLCSPYLLTIDPAIHGFQEIYTSDLIDKNSQKPLYKILADLVSDSLDELNPPTPTTKTTILNIKNPTGDFIKSLQYPIYNTAQNKSLTHGSVTILTKSVATSVPDEPSDGSWINPIDPTDVILPQQGAGKPYSLDVDNTNSGFDPNDSSWQYKWSTKNDDILLVNNGKTATIEAKCKNACNNRLPIAMNMVDPDGNRHYLAVKVFFASDGTTPQPITCTGLWSTPLFSIGMTETASQSCQTGYTGYKSISHVCQSNGQWGQVTTTDNCTVIPPTITNCTGEWTNQAYAIGATEEKYASACPTGSTGQVRSSHVCQSSGQWGGLATSDNCTAFLETPTNLYGSSTSNGIQLTWSKVSGAVSYYVYKMGIFLQEVFDNIFTDTNVSNGSTYQYEVAAHSTLNNQNVTSPRSSAVSTTYNAAQTGIVAPNGFNAARGTNGIVLSWQPVTGADAYYIYRYGYSNPTTGGNMLAALGASDSAFTDYSQVSLISGQSYCYFIRAVKGSALSPNSTDACSLAP